MSNCACPTIFDKSVFDGKECSWDGRVFYSCFIPRVYHVPLFADFFFNRMIKKMDKKGIKQLSGYIYEKDVPWLGSLLLEIEDASINDPMIRRFEGSRVYSVFWDGPWNQIRPGLEQLRREAKVRGDRVKEVILWFASCPECLEEHGYRTVIFGVLEPRQPVKSAEPVVNIVEPAGEGL